MSTLERNPKISIIVPCYNVAIYLPMCLDSIIGQTYKNLEIICINDGSTDNSLDILNDYCKIDDRIILINQNNKGLSETRNVGIDKSTGDYTMFVDSDDWLDQDLIKKTFSSVNECDLYCCSYTRVFNNKNIPRRLNLSGIYPAETIQKRMIGLTGKDLLDPSQADSIVTAWGKIYNTRILKDNVLRFVDTKKIGTEDALFNIQYLNFAKKVCVVDEPLYFYRRSNQGSLTSNYKSNLFIQWKYLYSLIYLEIKDKDKNYKEALANRICLGVLGLSLNETNSKNSIYRTCKNLKLILSDPLYKKSFVSFNLEYMPIHWKTFYFLAKRQSAIGVYFMANIMQLIKKLKNF